MGTQNFMILSLRMINHIYFAHQDRAPLVTQYADFPVESTFGFHEVSAMQAGLRKDVKQALRYRNEVVKSSYKHIYRWDFF